MRRLSAVSNKLPRTPQVFQEPRTCGSYRAVSGGDSRWFPGAMVVREIRTHSRETVMKQPWGQSEIPF
jgi:hypothetical protein